MKVNSKSIILILIFSSIFLGLVNSSNADDSKKVSNLGFICPVDSGKIITKFGKRTHPVLKVRRQHDGIDIETPRGLSVYATADGEIVLANRFGGYGKTIKIKHKDKYLTIYGHLSDIFVEVGQKVQKGHKIGTVGMTGITTSPHLHYEIRKDGVAIDPLELFSSDKLTD